MSWLLLLAAMAVATLLAQSPPNHAVAEELSASTVTRGVSPRGVGTAALVSWTSHVSGFWDVASNWSTGAAPAQDDDVLIDVPENITVTFRTATSIINSLRSTRALVLSGGSLSIAATSSITNAFTLSGGELTGSGILRVGGPLDWTGGTMSGTGRTEAEQALNISGAAVKSLSGRTLSNLGTATWTGTGDVSAGGGARFNNSGLFQAQNDQGFSLSAGTATFSNLGTFVKSAGTGATSFNGVGFDNHMTVRVQAGTLALRGGGFDTGTFDVGTGASLAFTAGTHTLNPGVAFSGPGSVQVGGFATVTVSADVTASNFELAGGILDGAGTLRVSNLVWTGGAMSGTGSTDVADSMSISGGNPKVFDRRTINLGVAVATWSGTGRILAGNGATLNNGPLATFEAQNDQFFSSAGAATFNNAGTFTKSGGLGTAEMLAAFNNTGAVEVQAGTLQLRDGTSTGSFTAGANAVVAFVTGRHMLNDGVTLAGPGTARVHGNAEVVVSGTVVSSAILELGGIAVITGPGQLDILNVLNWTDGAMSGTGSTNIGVLSTLSLVGVGSKFLSRTINNEGTTIWSGGTIQGGGGTVFNNLVGATFEVQSDNLFGGCCRADTFNNAGTIIKSGGLGTTDMVAVLNNTGAVEVQAGTLQLRGGTSTGAFTTAANAVVAFVGGTHMLNDGVTLEGLGTARVHGNAEVVVNGTVAASAILELGGIAVIDGPGTLAVLNQLNWTSGTMAGTGSTNIGVLSTLSIEGISGKDLPQRTINNEGTTIWSGGNIQVGGGTVFNNLAGATFEVQTDRNFSAGFGGAATFNNGGTFTKSGGPGTTAIVSAVFNNTGAVEVQAGTLQLGGRGSLSGTLTADSLAGASVLLLGTYTLNPGVTLNGPTLVASDATVQFSGMITAQDLRITSTLAVLQGSGTIVGNVANVAGTVLPSDDNKFAGLTIDGNFSQGASGTLSMPIGLAGCGGARTLNVSGTATFGGTLSVPVHPPCQPSMGQQFKIITFGLSSGSFDRVLPGFNADVVITATDLTLVAK